MVYEAKVSPLDLIFHIFLCTLGIGFFTIWGAIRRRKAKIKIYDKEIVVEQGRASKKSLSIPIRNIQSIGIEQSLMGRMFNYGTIHIETAGRNNCILDKMNKPYQVKEIIESLGATS